MKTAARVFLILACALVFTGLVPLAASAADAGDYGWKNTLESAMEHLDDSFYAEEGFVSPLPVLVMEAGGTVDFYLENEPLALEAGAGESAYQAQSRPYTQTANISGKPLREKKDYLLSFTQEHLAVASSVLWDAAVTDEWYLLGNMYDKSLLRNYLALSLAGDIHEDVPLVRHCELFVRNETGLHYEGVYLMVAPQQTEFVTLRRGSVLPEGATPLDTYALQERQLFQGLYVPAGEGTDDETLAQVEDGVSRAERSIFAHDYNEFSKYVNYVDTTKMFDYFLLYELLGNYGAMDTPAYSYDLQRGLLWPKATADFEFALDNLRADPVDPLEIRLMDAPYYAALFKNTNFIQGLVDRYKVLCQTVMKSGALEKRMDDAVLMLGEAQKRDWERWKAVYDGADMYWLAPLPPAADTDDPALENAPAMDRNTYSYEQEIVKLKFMLREHGQAMFAGIATLYDQEDMIGDDAPYVKNTWIFLVFLVIIIIAVRIVRRRTR